MAKVGEEFWIDLQPFLKSQGYLLRRRFQQSRKQSCKQPQKLDPWDETRVPLTRNSAIDAIRISDRRPVVLKRMRCIGGELVTHFKILSFPNSRRYITPIYDTILLPDTDETLLAILPLLRPVGSPCFHNVYEALDCSLQLVEGLAQLHANHCAHRDVSPFNILQQPAGMFPKGWHFSSPLDYHPGDPITSKALLKTAPFLPCTLASSRYLFIDFELSRVFEPDESPFQIGLEGSYRAPEMGDHSVSDAYATDVWAMGAVIKYLMSGPGYDPRHYKEARSILNPLVDKMMTIDPTMRPTAQHILEELHKIIRSLTNDQLRKTLAPKWIWTYAEIKYGVQAILQGKGDERILFARLRGVDPPKAKSFGDGSIREKFELAVRVYKFLSQVGEKGNVLEWLAPKHSSK